MAPALHVVTSRYANKDLASAGFVCVGVTRYRPRFPLAYELKANLRDLAPTSTMLRRARSGRLTATAFAVQYERLLERVGVERIVDTLRQLQGDAPGIALLCYENVVAGEHCHRRQLAEWLIKRKAVAIMDEFTTPALPVALGYCRISKAGDAKSVSIAAQKVQIASYAAARGWRLASTLEDNGISGGKRSRFDAIDAALKQHRAKALIVYSMDRAGRDVVGLLSWLERAERAGIQLHVCGKGQVETATPSGFLTTSIEATVAEHYRRITGEKTAAALRHLRLSGRRWANVAPYGWRWTQDGRVEADPGERATVERARTLRGEGLSLRALAAALASEGKLARSGRALSPEVLNSILRRPSPSASDQPSWSSNAALRTS